MQFFEIKAKCGHVGRGKYYEGIFYEIAENGRVAADIVRKRGRVKHDKKDAIISVRKVSFEEYQKGLENKENDLYFKCENIQDQNLIYDMICCNIKEEEKLQKTLEIDVEERKNIIKYKKQKNRQRVKIYNKYLLQEYAI